MEMIMNFCIRRCLLAFVAACSFGIASAQTPTTQPIKVIIGYAAGGPLDTITRLVANRMADSMKQTIIVENRPGANTIIAASQVAKAPADGHTLFMASSASLAVNPRVYKRMTYNPDEDFAAISMVAQAPLVMVVNQTDPASNL